MTRRLQVLWLPAVASILAAEVLLFLLTWAGAQPWTIPLDWHTLCGTAWLLVSFVLAPGVTSAVGLLAAVFCERRPGAAGLTADPLTTRA